MNHVPSFIISENYTSFISIINFWVGIFKGKSWKWEEKKNKKMDGSIMDKINVFRLIKLWLENPQLSWYFGNKLGSVTVMPSKLIACL